MSCISVFAGVSLQLALTLGYIYMDDIHGDWANKLSSITFHKGYTQL